MSYSKILESFYSSIQLIFQTEIKQHMTNKFYPYYWMTSTANPSSPTLLAYDDEQLCETSMLANNLLWANPSLATITTISSGKVVFWILSRTIYHTL